MTWAHRASGVGLGRNPGGGAHLDRRLALPIVARLALLLERISRIGRGLDHPVRLR